jgi:hypothetical protein
MGDWSFGLGTGLGAETWGGKRGESTENSCLGDSDVRKGLVRDIVGGDGTEIEDSIAVGELTTGGYRGDGA